MPISNQQGREGHCEALSRLAQYRQRHVAVSLESSHESRPAFRARSSHGGVVYTLLEVVLA